MTEQHRRQREMQAALKQIEERQQKQGRSGQLKSGHKWRLDVPMSRLAKEGIALFVLAFLVGRGVGSLYNIFHSWLFG